MSSTPTDEYRPPPAGDEPRIRRRAVWTTETARCGACDATVDLHEPHPYIRPTGARADDGEPVPFCSLRCARSFRDDAEF
jgi:endogenous inhibitor of DNA gyrase (YacG/DUF329 family)